MPLLNPFTWLAGKLGRSLAPALAGIAVTAGAVVALWLSLSGLVGLVRAERDAAAARQLAEATEAATRAAAEKNERAAAAEARQREAAEMREQAWALADRNAELEAEIKALAVNPLLFPARKGPTK